MWRLWEKCFTGHRVTTKGGKFENCGLLSCSSNKSGTLRYPAHDAINFQDCPFFPKNYLDKMTYISAISIETVQARQRTLTYF